MLFGYYVHDIFIVFLALCIRSNNIHDSITPIYSEENGPCMLVVYRMAYYRSAGLSRCVPMNAHFLRNTVQEIISDDVNQTEEYGIVTVALVVIEFVIGVSFGIAFCLKNRSTADPTHRDSRRLPCDGMHTRDPRDAFAARLE